MSGNGLSNLVNFFRLSQGSESHAARCAQCSQDSGSYRCDNLHNPFKSFLLRHKLPPFWINHRSRIRRHRRSSS